MGIFRSIKRSLTSCDDIDEKIEYLNKELEKTGLREGMTTTNVYVGGKQIDNPIYNSFTSSVFNSRPLGHSPSDNSGGLGGAYTGKVIAGEHGLSVGAHDYILNLKGVANSPQHPVSGKRSYASTRTGMVDYSPTQPGVKQGNSDYPTGSVAWLWNPTTNNSDGTTGSWYPLEFDVSSGQWGFWDTGFLGFGFLNTNLSQLEFTSGDSTGSSVVSLFNSIGLTNRENIGTQKTIVLQKNDLGSAGFLPININLSSQGYDYLRGRAGRAQRRSGGARKIRSMSGGPTYRKAGSGGVRRKKVTSMSGSQVPLRRGGARKVGSGGVRRGVTSMSGGAIKLGKGGRVTGRGVMKTLGSRGVGFSPSAGKVVRNVAKELPPKPTPAEIRKTTVDEFRKNGDNYAANKFYTEDRISELESKPELTSTEQSELDQLKVNAVHLNQNAPPDPIPPRPRAEVEKDYTPAEVTEINNEIERVTSAEEQQETFASVASELEKAVVEKKITPKEKNTLMMKMEASANAGSDLPQEVATVIANLGLPVLSLFDKRFESMRGAWNTLRGHMDNNEPLSPNFRAHDPTSENYKGPKEIKMSNGVRKQASDELNLALESLNGGKGPRNPNGQLEADEITDVSEWMKNNQFKNEGTLAFYNSLHSLPPDTTTINLNNGKFSNLESNYWFTDPKDGDVYDTTGSPEAGFSTLMSNLITGVEKQARANKDLVGGNDYHERDKNAEGGRGDVIGKQFNTQMGFTSYDEYKPEGLSRIANGFLDAITGNKFDFDRRGGNDASKYPPPKQESIFTNEDGTPSKYYTRSIFTGKDGKTYKSVLYLPYTGDNDDGSPRFGSLYHPGSYNFNIPLFDTPMDEPLGDYTPPDDLPDIPFTPPEPEPEPDNRKDYEKNRDKQRRLRRSSYELEGNVLSEEAKLGHFEPEQLTVDIEKLRKGIMPEFPKDPPPKMVDGYSEKSKLAPKTIEGEPFINITKKDLAKNHMLKDSEIKKFMDDINLINKYIKENPSELAYAQIRYPKDDPRLAQLNWQMDQMLDASNEYMDKHYPENQKLFTKIQKSIKKNIELTDPKSFKGVKVPKFEGVDLSDFKRRKEVVARHYKKAVKTKKLFSRKKT